ncbi:hypothetical protein HKX54_17435 [Sulfitobacter sp. M57]|uniref:hypothetical protein n=1 Tax=unclassified Sulfitobacter TaxID=196795 RepID=UPI0023E251B8|nr:MULTISPECIES: hypothetical protein [unclassified Sulfitobacter]MDF3416258.1 hypothetical protein [Sulfitobacter sp. KE5]MDF3423737.1 hypothetical protein [Sulfitobacter sp. KE43]MDF3434804.1 hypothetical protein [Sulfitobacter sp. KE42]MDF3460443.1 hypothetical protein [Sulfitobacter sp. S74]MDF3464341.1 hypothetical protein [Sulfitobacter sp. Ks18]
MHAQQAIGYAPRTRALARDLEAQHMVCVGCDDCRGICQALLDSILIPNLILKDRRP